jgi:hypothetical protein
LTLSNLCIFILFCGIEVQVFLVVNFGVSSLGSKTGGYSESKVMELRTEIDLVLKIRKN